MSANILGFTTDGNETLRIAADGQLGIGGANYGTDGQVLTSTGASTAPAWEDAGGGGASTLGELTDVLLDDTNFTDGLLIQTDSDGSAPTTGTLSGAVNNIGIGSEVFGALTSAQNNVVIGNDAGKNLLSGHYNTLLGDKAGIGLTTGQANVIIGNQEFSSAVMTGSFNVHVGRRAGEDVTDGTYNTLVGAGSGQNVTTGDYNVYCGV